MAEKPIIFTGDLIPAILDNHKTQTRRVCRDQTANSYVCGSWETFPKTRGRYEGWAKDCGHGFLLPTRSPYQVGDILWVRETCWRNGGYVATDPPTIQNEGKVPSIFMPRLASRISLEVTDVRVERVQDITLEDARAEGISEYGHEFRGMKAWLGDDIYRNRTTVENFAWLWDSLNTKRGCSWETNPWVWVYTFKRLENANA